MKLQTITTFKKDKELQGDQLNLSINLLGITEMYPTILPCYNRAQSITKLSE